MDMTNSDIFLELYKELEETLSVRYSGSKKPVGSVIMRFFGDDDGRKWREELNICREMRNMLSHHAMIGGKAVFEPSDEIIGVLRQILNEVKNPPVAMSVATPYKRLFTCTGEDSVEEISRKMKSFGYSHVPVMKGRRLIGVFSVGTVFAALEKYGSEWLRSCKRIGDLEEFLPIDEHITERFGFVSDSAAFTGLKYRFTANSPSERKLAALFVTENGNDTEDIMGMITPWDMIKNTPQ